MTSLCFFIACIGTALSAVGNYREKITPHALYPRLLLLFLECASSCIFDSVRLPRYPVSKRLQGTSVLKLYNNNIKNKKNVAYWNTYQKQYSKMTKPN